MWGMIQDIRTQKITNYYLKTGGVISIVSFVVFLCNRDHVDKQMLLCFLPGLIFLFTAKITKEQIGYGDGYVLLIIGSCLLNVKIWKVWEMSILLSTCYTVIFILFRKINRKDKIPFLPFLWLSHLLLWSMKYV